MILQALYEYYQRKSADPENTDMAPAGWQWKEIPFVLVIDHGGNLVSIDDYRDGGKKNRSRAFLVSHLVTNKSSNIAAEILWGTPSYVFGWEKNKRQDRLKKQQKAFFEKIRHLPEDDVGVQAALKWLSVPEKALAQVQTMSAWSDIEEKNPFMALRLEGDIDENGSPMLICQRPLVQKAIAYMANDNKQESRNDGLCLITGERGFIGRLHPFIKGIPGAQTSGAAIVSFNQKSFCSYGKEQGDNAPVGEAAADAYTKALNYLLRKDSRQKIQCGNTTTVFWARRADEPLEDELAFLFGGQDDKDDPDARTNAIHALLSSPHKGGGAGLSADDKFYVLGLSPNAARLSVRFWLPTTVADVKKTLAQWFEDIHLAGGKTKYPPLRSLLSSLALEYKLDNLSPLLEGEMLESIFRGGRFPQTLLVTALRRMRAEQSLPHLRAALIKAALIRNYNRKDIKMSLDPNNEDPAYNLGRLFAIMEKTQQDQGVSTIGERYFSAASSRPGSVFPVLHKLNKHHQRKLMGEKPGIAVNREKLMAEVMNHMNPPYPSVLSLEGQGAFAIGYYHQRQDFFTKKEEPEEEQQAA